MNFFMSALFSDTKKPKPLILVILDGWGLSENKRGNAILDATLPTIDKLNAYYPQIALQASGISVGLPWGEPGNSEVGHTTLGLGKVIYQSLPRITMSIQNGEFFKNPSFLKAIENSKKNGSAIHLMGLVGKGSVHSTTDHIYALLELLRDQKAEKVFFHVFTDGRDCAHDSGAQSIQELETRMNQYGIGKIASIGGRYFGMDRNNNWDRIEKAYLTMTKGCENKIENPEKYLRESYKKEIYDEYIEPACVCKNGEPIGIIKENDSVIFFNYREDRARQITKSFTVPGFSKFPAIDFKNLFFLTMTQYEESIPAEVAYPPVKIVTCLGKVLSENNLKQLRISETEKFAHVTYFFNGGAEDPFPGEDRIIVPSKDVATFDLAPKMSAQEITQKIIENLEKDIYNFILVNFANPDIVGHTGNEKAAIEGIEFVDSCLKELIPLVLQKEGCFLITADHGNVEEMINVHTGEIDTEHSTNPVPLWYLTATNHSSEPKEFQTPEISGILSDIAPTVLNILGIEKHPDMTGESLLGMLE